MTHLEKEISTYLHEHQDDPVNWHPWGDDAIALARKKNRPILLSIGHSGSHQCKVMGRESFASNQIAKLMNNQYVNILVDREERRDIDRLYQTAHRLLTRSGGGWPLTVFIDPNDLLPFYSGTYFPAQANESAPAFRDVLNRILPMLDYDIIRANPKVLIGYSDVTALLHGIFLETGLVCFHGPVGASNFTDYTTKQVTDVLMTPKVNQVIPFPKENLSKADPAYQPYVIQSGKATGQLIGGNLTLVTSLMGTPYELDLKDKLVFLEDIGEKPYRLDRMFTQLLLAGKLQDAVGIVLGVFSDCEAGVNDNSLTLREMMEDRLTNLGIPVVYGMSFGHIGNNFTIPMGINATIDTKQKTLTLLETAVA